MENYDVLIVDDDTDINNMVSDALKKSGYTSMQAFSGTEGIFAVKMYKFKIIILDLMLPGMSGEEFIQKSREIVKIPIIVMSAKNDIEGKVKCLEYGAEDYITKPFDIKELVARVMVQMRRSHTQDDSIGNVSFKDIMLLPDGCTLKCKEGKVMLTRQEYRIMELLMSSPKLVFSKQSIYDYAWDEVYEGEDKTVNVHISNIRKKLKDITDEEYIATVWGIGFKMNE